ncbi:hypothetical protein DVH24_038122 [Malus domestica]|uniref:KANL3/Tex30 alpha/beta hydrolase-like domain-containing protein n=1 Tax=Malus domestica TaxID=3750 RepID=A0A498K8U4_MALDO|nr:hypothetical protein DVH24_038122 [Malus domestica]
MRGVGRSTGRASLTGFAEIKDVIAVCKWVSENLSADMILLVGSSAGAPIAGSAVNQIEQVVGYVSLGYPFGMLASILFGRHHKAVLQSSKPKLFVMGTQDGFTSVKQLKNKLKLCSRSVETHLIDGASHFQMEGPAYDAQMELGCGSPILGVLRLYDFVFGKSRATSQWVTHPRSGLASFSLNFEVPMEPEASELLKDLVLGGAKNRKGDKIEEKAKAANVKKADGAAFVKVEDKGIRKRRTQERGGRRGTSTRGRNAAKPTKPHEYGVNELSSHDGLDALKVGKEKKENVRKKKGAARFLKRMKQTSK